jgi:hypothetical protein
MVGVVGLLVSAWVKMLPAAASKNVVTAKIRFDKTTSCILPGIEDYDRLLYNLTREGERLNEIPRPQANSGWNCALGHRQWS